MYITPSLIIYYASVTVGFLCGLWSSWTHDTTGFMIQVGEKHSCLLSDGKVKCWGLNHDGQLGLGDKQNRGDKSGEMGIDLPNLDFGSDKKKTVYLAVGWSHGCVILSDSSLKCWGWNAFGQLGLGDINSRGDQPGEMGKNLPSVDLGTGRTARIVAAGWLHTCAILDDSSVKCWGDNAFGQLGLGDKVSRGIAGNQMGDQLSPVNLGAGRTAKRISCGTFHTCAVLDDDSLKCWGYNLWGQLGLGDIRNRGTKIEDMGDNLSTVNLGADRTVVDVSAGSIHTCAMMDDSSLKCWGNNDVGQLGLGDLSCRGGTRESMGDNLPAVDLGTDRTVIAVSTGRGSRRYHMCAVLDDFSLKCWGDNAHGQLGIGDIQSVRGDMPEEMGDQLPAVSLGNNRAIMKVSVGMVHTCVVLDNAKVKCWGINEKGQLGIGNTEDRFQLEQMGDELQAVDIDSDEGAICRRCI